MALAILAMSCDISVALPSAPLLATAAPGVVETIVAGTAGAAQTQTAVLIPPTSTTTFTPTVTRTPTAIPTETPTFIFRLRSATPPRTATPTQGSTTSGKLSCVLLSQEPDDGTVFKRNAKFDAIWEVRNTGTATWDKDNVDFTYATGRKMHEEELYDLPRNVASGASIRLIADLVAPKIAGSFTTVWTLRRADTDFCHVDVTIVVK